MKSKYERYTQETIIGIAEDLSDPNIRSASEAARNRGLDVSGYVKHVKQFRSLRETAERNKCSRKYSCKIRNGACAKCFYLSMYGQSKGCAGCKNNCNDTCPEFTKAPDCPRIRKFPYVCNGCPRKERCRLCKYVYDPEEVWRLVKARRSEPRRGIHADEEELNRLSAILVPLVKGMHQSLPQIFQTHRAEIRWSYPTVLKLIDQGLVPGLRNIDLTKRVKYPRSYRKGPGEPTNLAFLTGRTYDDFVAFVSEDPGVEVVEMDTVLSGRGDPSCLLTLLFRKSNFMLAFKLARKTPEEVRGAFDAIRARLGNELYSKAFGCILTDNGGEFADPRGIEFDPGTGERLCRLFYCDPGNSGQKGKIEKNHVELRKVFPKGTLFSAYAQGDVDLALSHINSEPRAVLNRCCPGDVAKAFIDPEVIGLNNYTKIKPDEVKLHPDLLGK